MSFKTIDRTSLKLFAMFAMLLDHIAVAFFPGNALALRLIGRCAFPIFSFFIVEGYLHTSNKAKYAFRLLICALVSEIPFDLLLASQAINMRYQNTVFTLLSGYCAIYCIDRISEFKYDKALYQTLVSFFACLLASLLHFDYGFWGVLFIIVLYVFRNHKYRIVLSSIPLLFCGVTEIIGIIALFFTSNYGGKNKYRMKYLFYIFYPLHLFALFLLRSFLR